jgi:chromosome segregation ATPase
MARLTLADQLAAATTKVSSLEEQLHTLRHAAAQKDAEHAAKVVEFEKKLKDKDQSYSYQSSNLTIANNEIEQAHAVLDGVEGAPTRDYEKEGGYGKTQRNVVTRLAGAFLAIARNGGVK